MRQTVAVGIIKSVDKTEKSGGKGKQILDCQKFKLLMVNVSDEVR